MSLRDKACYTLTLDPSPLQPGIIELNEFLVDGSKAHQAQYIRAREEKEGEAYSASVYGAVYRLNNIEALLMIEMCRCVYGCKAGELRI